MPQPTLFEATFISECPISQARLANPRDGYLKEEETPNAQHRTSNVERKFAFDVGCWTFSVRSFLRIKEGWLSPV